MNRFTKLLLWMSVFKDISTLAGGLIERIFYEILKSIKTLRKEDGDR